MAQDFSTAMELQNDLWHFALQFYANPEIESLCLELQNQNGCSVNRLIFAVWAAKQRLALNSQDILSSPSKPWQEQVTHPIRAVRYQVKAHMQAEPALAELYTALRKAELQAEQAEIAYLYQLASQRTALDRSGSAESLLQANLAAVTFNCKQQGLAQRLQRLCSVAKQSLAVTTGSAKEKLH